MCICKIFLSVFALLFNSKCTFKKVAKDEQIQIFHTAQPSALISLDDDDTLASTYNTRTLNQDNYILLNNCEAKNKAKCIHIFLAGQDEVYCTATVFLLFLLSKGCIEAEEVLGGLIRSVEDDVVRARGDTRGDQHTSRDILDAASSGRACQCVYVDGTKAQGQGDGGRAARVGIVGVEFNSIQKHRDDDGP